MAADNESLEEKFPDLDAVDRFLGRKRMNLMDLNHKIYREALREAELLDDYASDVCNLIEEMKQALAVGAMLTAQIMADKIKSDYGIVPADEVGEEHEEEEEMEGGEEE